MILAFHITLFFVSGWLLMISGERLIKSLSKISDFLDLQKFTVAFLLMSLATSAPELFIGISSALRGVSELSLGNIVGQNIIHFTVAVFIVVLIRGEFSIRSETTKITALFSGFMALFPLILIFDGSLSRIDGVILIILFLAYVVWMISVGRKYSEVYDEFGVKESKSFWVRVKIFFSNMKTFFVGVAILIIASQGIVQSSMFFASSLNTSLVIIGVLIVSLGTTLPEIYFSAYSAKEEDGELMAGNLLGSTVVSTSLVLGVVAIISPINNIEIFSYFLSRITLFLSVILFIYFMLTDRKITKKEGWILLILYLTFVFLEITI